jgi:phosphomannomutase
MDGVRVDLKNGWVLIRSSNTSPIIRLTTEADNEKTLGQLTTQFMDKTEEIIEKIKGETK